MSAFVYNGNQLAVENVLLSDIARSVGTPCYIYSSKTITDNYKEFALAIKGLDALISYSVKANSSLAVLKTLANLGAGADVVSGGELARALAAGISPEKIVFSGVGKTKDEMRMALKAGILQFNVESVPEIFALNEIAKSLNVTAPVALRINPDVAAGGHAKITTGKSENKFGIAIDDAVNVYNEIASLEFVRVRGIDMHIGSQIDDLSPFEIAIDKLLGLVKKLKQNGHEIKSFDVGGGLGICYGQNDNVPSAKQYGEMLAQKFAKRDMQIILEPGRAIAANAGILLSEVIYVKQTPSRNFLIIDAAMNDLIRPALYDANHNVRAVVKNSHKQEKYDIVGPVCESGDTFAKDYNLQKMRAGELVIIENVGAYGSVQASQYNTRPLIPEVLVKGDKFAITRNRPSIEEILSVEKIPHWLEDKQ